MENVAFSSSFEILTCDVFSDAVALFLAGLSLLPGTSGRGERWELARRVQDEISGSKCAIFCHSGWAWWPSLVSETDTPSLVIVLLATVPKYPHHLLSMEGNSKMPSVPLRCLIFSHAYTHHGNCI